MILASSTVAFCTAWAAKGVAITAKFTVSLAALREGRAVAVHWPAGYGVTAARGRINAGCRGSRLNRLARG